MSLCDPEPGGLVPYPWDNHYYHEDILRVAMGAPFLSLHLRWSSLLMTWKSFEVPRVFSKEC